MIANSVRRNAINFRKQPCLITRSCYTGRNHSEELRKTLRALRTDPSDAWTTLKEEWKALEKEMNQFFDEPSPERVKGPGVRKHMPYLLLDPLITQDLPKV